MYLLVYLSLKIASPIFTIMKHKLLLAAFGLASLGAFGQKAYWKPVTPHEAQGINKGAPLFTGDFVPYEYKLFTLEEQTIRTLIQQAPMEGKNSLSTISLPVADGSIERFRIVEAPVMVPELQARYPQIRSYAGQGIDDPKKTVRFDISPIGLHATISVIDGKTTYINPINNAQQLYVVNARNEKDKSPSPFVCATDGTVLKGEAITANKTTFTGNVDDGKLHTYRLALCVTGTWSKAIMNGTEVTTQDSINTVMSNINAYLVRANEVYERDLGIRLVFVNNEDTLIFLNPNTDPFTSSNLNSKCQQTCDGRIGNANYDVGHVIDKYSSNGNAGCIDCVCTTGSKGSGMTQYSSVSTAILVDYFIIDYWTHEMGHQVGANHTFTFSSEGTLAQTEPGSGSTIMGYAGITGNTDVQPHSDDLFSCAGVAQISNSYKSATRGGRCAVKSNIGNKPPVVDGGKDYTIPKKTPFVLTGNAGDTNTTDLLSYVWEQTDVMESGSSAIPKGNNTKGPMYRTYNYTASPSRYFPQLSDILLGKDSTKFEVLSNVTRDLNFRFTARDNHPGGGNNKSDDVLIKVDGTSGPFKIAYPNTAISKKVGDTLKVTWSVNNTNLAPVNCQKVRIVLSTDGGQNFTTFLAKSVPNNGSAIVTIPNKLTTQARIAVIAVGNIFFDVTNSNFTIKAAVSGAQPENAIARTGSTVMASVSPNPATDVVHVTFNTDMPSVTLMLVNSNGKTVYSNKLAFAQKGAVANIPVGTLTKGLCYVKIISDNNVITEKLIAGN